MSSSDLSAPPASAWPWTFFAIGTGFALYWISNVILWFPWSISDALGITIMLTIQPLVWAFGIVQVLRRWPGRSLWVAAAWTALIMLIMSIASDLVFFGILRSALDDLLRPTTYAAYGWVALLPLIVVLFGRGWLRRHAAVTTSRAIVVAFAIGFVAMAVIAGIIAFDIRIATG